jgi:hypothetical protein
VSRKIAWLLLLVCAGCEGFRQVGPGDAGTTAPFAVEHSRPDAGSLNAIWGSSETDVHAVGDNGMILDWDGHSWKELVGTTGATLGGVWGSGPTDVYAVGTLTGDGRGLVLHNDGANGWTEEIELPTGLVSVWGIEDQRFAAGLGGVIYKKTATRDWYKLIAIDPNPYVPTSPNAPVAWGIAGSSVDSIFVAADIDTNVEFVGNGTWVPLYDPVDRTRTYRSVWAISGPSPFYYVGANYYGAWQYADANSKAIQLHEEKDTAERASQFLWGIWAASSDRVVFCGDAGRIMTFDGNSDLRTVPSGTTQSLFGVWGASANRVWFVGNDALIMSGPVTF